MICYNNIYRGRRVLVTGHTGFKGSWLALLLQAFGARVTGYALPNSADPDRQVGGAKSTHLAVPAGAVYYFRAASEADAKSLAAALNWHGSNTNPTTIRNRRSTLMGEKGFGLGVCTNWDFHSANS
jgi:nucleoside-diphosphate-sugar epimerase